MLQVWQWGYVVSAHIFFSGAGFIALERAHGLSVGVRTNRNTGILSTTLQPYHRVTNT
jgi:hypothetical protein